jgi:hypothetical protein
VKYYGAVFAMKAALIVLVIADIAVGGWFSNVLTVHRPGRPEGIFLLPYQTHGGVTYISKLDSSVDIALLVGGALLVAAWWLVTRFEKHLDRR